MASLGNGCPAAPPIAGGEGGAVVADMAESLSLVLDI